MRKIVLFVLLLTIVSSVHATEDTWLKAYEFAYKFKGQEWSEWISCYLDIKITSNKVIIYSKETQIYNILRETDTPYDNNGEQVGYLIKDQDGDYGRIRLRFQNNGAKQIYIDFDNISWVYSVK